MEKQILNAYQSTIVFADENFIQVKPLCDFFGITYRGAIKRIKSDPILKFEWNKSSQEMLFGDRKWRLCVTKRGFIRWIQLLNGTYVRPELRESLVEYQRYIFDYLYGDMQTTIKACIDYKKLKDLRHQYGKIGREIQSVQSQLFNFLDANIPQQAAIAEAN